MRLLLLPFKLLIRLVLVAFLAVFLIASMLFMTLISFFDVRR